MALDMCVCTVFRWFHSTHLVANNTLVGKTCCDREGSVPKKNDASRNVSHKKSHLDLWRMVRTHKIRESLVVAQNTTGARAQRECSSNPKTEERSVTSKDICADTSYDTHILCNVAQYISLTN